MWYKDNGFFLFGGYYWVLVWFFEEERVLIMLVFKFFINLIKWRFRMRFIFIKGNKDIVMFCIFEFMVWDLYYYIINDGMESLY